MKTFGVKVENNNFETFVVQNNQVYKSQEYTVEGDYSSAAYFFAAGAITKQIVTVRNLNTDSEQGDKRFVFLLEEMGCAVKQNADGFSVLRNKELNAIDVSMSNQPDTVQTLAVIAAFAKGNTKIRDIDHLRFKESDRISTTIQELAKMGIQCSYKNKTLYIAGGKPNGAQIETHNDHRVAMSFAIAALGAKGETVIQNAEVVNKSYPNFFDDLQSVGAKIEKI